MSRVVQKKGETCELGVREKCRRGVESQPSSRYVPRDVKGSFELRDKARSKGKGNHLLQDSGFLGRSWEAAAKVLKCERPSLGFFLLIPHILSFSAFFPKASSRSFHLHMFTWWLAGTQHHMATEPSLPKRLMGKGTSCLQLWWRKSPSPSL